MKIYIASDHSGVDLKAKLIDHLKSKNIQMFDLGTNTLESVDYPDYANDVSHHVTDDVEALGILICGTGIGMSIAANKVKGIRAALIYDQETAMLAKAHNHANIICLGARKTSTLEAILCVDTFLETHVEERHLKRINKII